MKIFSNNFLKLRYYSKPSGDLSDIHMIRHKFFWVIVGMAFIATALSFLDRQTMSILIIQIKQELNISDVQYGFINTGFLIGYAIMFTGGGMIIDRYGSRIGLALSVGLWSLSTALHSVANTVFQFGSLRFLLGVGEGGAFPGAIKAVTEWVPKKKHALANGIAIGGSALGAVIAPPLCVYIAMKSGWRSVFLITGLIGCIWVLIWLLLTARKITLSENTSTKIISQSKVAWEMEKHINLLKLLRIKEVWAFIFMRFLLDPILYFYMFWIPKYLNETHGLEIAAVGKLFWIPFLALGFSNILGGWISDTIYLRTSNLNFARKIVMGIAALLMLPVLIIRFTHSPETVILLLSIAFFAHGLWITNYITSISDLFGRKVNSTIIGLSGTAGAVSAFIINPVIGLIITHISYNPMWIYAGLMYPVAYIGFIIIVPKIRLLESFA
jgi:ACS family hexuronate transporter-like MFS transporter